MPLRSLLIVCTLCMLAPIALAQPATVDEAAIKPDSLHMTQIVEAGTLAGEIQACEVDWETYYIAYMQSERRRAANEGWPQEKIAFIGAFFGAIQARTHEQHKDKECPLERLPVLAERVGAVIDAAREREGSAP